MQMHKYVKILVKRADFSLIMLRCLNTGTMFFFIIIIIVLLALFIYLFVCRILSYSIVHLSLPFIILHLY